jgi:hypothetical protein
MTTPGQSRTVQGCAKESAVDRSGAPNCASLTTGLATILCSGTSRGDEVTIIDRAPNPYESQVASDVITCRTADGRTIQVLCKYGGPHDAADSHAHWGGVTYEAVVYRTLLGPLSVGAPHFYGTYEEPDTGRTWLVLEYVNHAFRVSRCPDPGAAMASAAGWLGSFHARAERWLTGQTPSFRWHEAAYYQTWAHRTLKFARRTGHASSWLQSLCERPEGFIRPLLEASPTVIHGEFYPENILTHKGQIRPIDWETAAIAPGHIDLASLTEWWEPQIASRCKTEYTRSRWASQPPAHFDRTLTAARVYWQMRWLGDRPEWQEQEVSQRRFSALRAAGERLGMI